MKQLAKISMGVLLLSLTVLSVKQSNVKSDLNLDIQNLLHINQVLAESGDCSFLAKCRNWNGGSWYPDGIDCMCCDREEVYNCDC